jgi:hypothetical protein
VNSGVTDHHNAETYLEAAGISAERKSPPFRSAAGKNCKPTGQPLARRNALDMVKRRVIPAGLSDRVCCHTFRVIVQR